MTPMMMIMMMSASAEQKGKKRDDHDEAQHGRFLLWAFRPVRGAKKTCSPVNREASLAFSFRPDDAPPSDGR
jgi:hypothetical protein